MEVIFTLEEVPEKINKSIFLAGPTSRDGGSDSWRKAALQILDDKGFDGVVFVPEARDWDKFNPEYDEQVSWEDKCLNIADCILFWIPRDLEKLPAFTTNDEWGYWKGSGKVVLGCPDNAQKVSYQKFYGEEYKVPFAKTLSGTMQNAIDQIGEGHERAGGERFVPLCIWNTDTFQQWYKSQTESGNRLDWARPLWNFRPGNKEFVFLWILQVHVYISSEDRVKTNEFVLSRTNISSVLLWHKNEKDLNESKVVLVKEFRSPAVTKDSFIRELVGGSSASDRDPLLVAVEEVKEETGFQLHPSRLEFKLDKQLAGTLSAHKSFLYSVELNSKELEYFENEVGKPHGNKEDSEITYVEIVTINQILSGEVEVDWSTVGQILSVVR